MVSRRSFLRLIRNRVAAGVLCSGMLAKALEGFPLAEIYPSTVPKITYVSAHYALGFKVSHEIIEDDVYSSINVMGQKWVIKGGGTWW